MGKFRDTTGHIVHLQSPSFSFFFLYYNSIEYMKTGMDIMVYLTASTTIIAQSVCFIYLPPLSDYFKAHASCYIISSVNNYIGLSER
jgi:hypothetical protein